MALCTHPSCTSVMGWTVISPAPLQKTSRREAWDILCAVEILAKEAGHMEARSLPRNVAGILSGRQSTVPEGPGEPSEVSKTRCRKAECHHLSLFRRVSHNSVGTSRDTVRVHG